MLVFRLVVRVDSFLCAASASDAVVRRRGFAFESPLPRLVSIPAHPPQMDPAAVVRAHDDDAPGQLEHDDADVERTPTRPRFHPEPQDEHSRKETEEAEPDKTTQIPPQADRHSRDILHEAHSMPRLHVPASWSAGAAPLTMGEFLQQSQFERRAETDDGSSSRSHHSSVSSSRYPSSLPTRSRSGGLSLSGPPSSIRESTRSHSSLPTLSGGSASTRKFAFPSATRLDFNSQPVSRDTTAPSTPIAEEEENAVQLKADNALVDQEQTTHIEPAPTIIESHFPTATRPPQRTDHGIGPSVAVGIFGGAIYGSGRGS